MTTNDYKERKKKHDFYSRLVPRYQYGGQHSEYFIDLIKIPKLHRKDTAKSTRRNCSFSHQLFFLLKILYPSVFSLSTKRIRFLLFPRYYKATIVKKERRRTRTRKKRRRRPNKTNNFPYTNNTGFRAGSGQPNTSIATGRMKEKEKKKSWKIDIIILHRRFCHLHQFLA